jgi:hypothetical protein
MKQKDVIIEENNKRMKQLNKELEEMKKGQMIDLLFDTIFEANDINT